MLIRHIGHAEFLLVTESGVRIVTDPYDASCGYPLQKTDADIALISHHHHDHDAVENLRGEPRIIDKAGQYTPEPDVKVTAVKGFHDDEHGNKRGETLLFLIETEGLRIVHLGDLGCALDENQLEQLKKPDILMIPIGGFYTIGAEQAKQTAEQLEARLILPMHYKTEFNQDWPISGPEAFLEQFDTNDICQGAEAVRVTKADLECQPRIITFSTGR